MNLFTYRTLDPPTPLRHYNPSHTMRFLHPSFQWNFGPTSCRTGPKFAHGSTEVTLRERRSNAKFAFKRLQEKCAAHHSFYDVKPVVLKRFVGPAAGINTQKLKSAKNGWTGSGHVGDTGIYSLWSAIILFSNST